GFSTEYIEYQETLTVAPGQESLTGRVLLEGKAVQISDVLADPEYSLAASGQRLGGFRTHLGVPLLREGRPIGVILVSRRTVRPFDNKHIWFRCGSKHKRGTHEPAHPRHRRPGRQSADPAGFAHERRFRGHRSRGR